MKAKVVLDTNVLVAALRSSSGASFALLSRLRTEQFQPVLSVALVLEYEDALMRHLDSMLLGEDAIRDLVDFLCHVGHRQEIFFLWRPCLPDPQDDMLLELAVAARATMIVTHNLRDFRGAENFGIEAIAPKDFLNLLRRKHHEHP